MTNTKTKTKTIMFTASWCPPCQTVKRMLHRTGNEALLAELELVDIDSPEGEKLADQHKVLAIPTFLSPDGRTHTGGLTKRELIAFLKGS